MSGTSPVGDAGRTTSSPSTGLGRRLAANTFHAASGRVAAVLVWLFFTPMVLHHLGPEGFAIWALFFALTGQLSALDFGLVQGTLRHVSAARERGDHEEAGAFATLALLGYAALGLIWLVVLGACGDAGLSWLHIPAAQADSARFALWLGAAVFVVSGFANVTVAIAQAYGRFDVANGITLTLTAQHAIGIPIVIHYGWGMRGLVLNVLLGWTLGLTLGSIWVRAAVPEFRWGRLVRSFRHVREAARFGAPLQLTSLLWSLNVHVDKLLLARLVALATVTPYELGARVALSAFTFPQLLLSAVLPTAAAMHATHEGPRLRELHDRVGRYLLAAIAITIALLVGSSNRLYLAWLGPGHEEAAQVLRWLAVSSGVLLTAGIGSVVARGIGRTELETWFHVASLTLHVGISVWLLPRIGLLGALTGSLVGNIAGTVVFITLVARAMKWKVMDLLVKPHLVPIIAASAGAAAGIALDHAVPHVRGVMAWAMLGYVAAAGGLTALAVTLMTRYISWREVTYLITHHD
jgi:O-antigen/teichoic acid export membrane protein